MQKQEWKSRVKWLPR